MSVDGAAEPSRARAAGWQRRLAIPGVTAAVAAVAAGLLLAAPLPAQSSIVPATHAVYDWLHQQRVFGRLPEYESEVRPTSRGVILGYLRTVERDSAQLSATDRGLLEDFLNEFDFERLRQNGLFRRSLLDSFPSGVWRAARARRDPYLLAGTIGDTSITGALWLQKGWGEGWQSGAGSSDYGFIWARGVRAFVNSSSGLGFHVEADLATANSKFVLRADPRLGANEGFLADSTYPPVASESWVSYRRKNFDVALGTGAEVIGPAITDPLTIRLGAPSLNALRLTIGPPRFHLMVLHGQLVGPTEVDTTWFEGKLDSALVPVPRWVAMSRLTWSPNSRLTLAAHQMTVYSQRGFDFQFLNPILPSLFGGTDRGTGQQSPDNGFFGLDVVGRPFTGTEAFLSVLIDDAAGYNLRAPGSDYQKGSASVGVEQRLPYDVVLGLGWLHVDAFAYTSWIPTDAWSIRGVPIGPDVGPNADELALRLTRWFPWRTRVMLGTRRIRKGLNPVDSLGNVTSNVGGDLNDPTDLRTRYPFLQDADVQTFRRDEVDIETEPIRGFHISAHLTSIVGVSGTRIPALHTWLVRWRFGF